MDPDQTLRDIRRALADLHDAAESEAEPNWGDVDELMYKVEVLDEWLSTGGFLPKEWKR